MVPRVNMKSIITFFHFIALILSSVGISDLTNILDGRNSWMKSQCIRTRIILDVLDYLCLNHKENVSKETESHRIKEDNSHLNSILDYIKTCWNPLTEGGRLIKYRKRKGCLVRNFKFSPKHECNWTAGRKRFTQRCLDNPSKFPDQIPKIKASTFATEELQIKRKKADGKIEILNAAPSYG